MLSHNKFNGELDGKTIYDFTKQLDYSLCQKDRIDLINKILNTQKAGNDTMLPDKYFEEIFEQKDLEGSIDTSHIKLCLTTKDNLFETNNVCKELDKMADYILFAPDGDKINKKTEYNFYGEEEFQKLLKRENSLEQELEKNEYTYVENEKIDFLIRKEKNYKKSIEQKITSKDLIDEDLKCLKDYNVALINLQEQLDIEKEKSKTEKNFRKRYLLGKHIRNIKENMILCKDHIKGTIYFKQPLSDSTEIDYEQFDFLNREHIMALLKIQPRHNLSHDLDCLTQDIQRLIDKCNLAEKEKQVLEMWRIEDNTQEKMAEYLNISQPAVNKILNRICIKIMYEFEKEYENWYYFSVVKGKYKKCNCCGEVKLLTERYYRKRRDDKGDGYYNKCIICEQIK